MPKCECNKRCLIKWLWTNLLLILMILAMAAGIGLGIGLRQLDPSLTESEIIYLKFPGELLLRMLKMLILPLVVASIISGMVDTKASGKMGLRAVIYYITTTVSAVILGIILVLTIRPGEYNNEIDKAEAKELRIDPADSFLDLIRNVFPQNLVAAAFQKSKTKLGDKNVNKTINGTEVLTAIVTKEVITASGMNILGIIAFSLFFGGAIARTGKRGRPLAKFFVAMMEAVTILIGLVMWYSPIGIMFLIAGEVVAMEDALRTMTQLALYIATVLSGLVIHGYIILPLIYFIFTRKNPFRFIGGMIEALVTALATASSSATLPITMRCLEENNHIDSRITRFMAPIGATINMDGTALYEAVATIFIAQLTNTTLSVSQVIIVCITATLAAIGAAGVPQAGLVTMVIVLSAVGLKADNIAYILAVDWFLDRCRTSVNVLGDSFGAGIVNHLSRKELDDMDMDKDNFEDFENNGKGINNRSYNVENDVTQF